MKNVNYYSRKALRQETARLEKLLEKISLQQELLHRVALRRGYTDVLDIKRHANQLNANYWQGQLDGIQIALRLMK